MPLELQLKRTPGTVYGEIMRDSGVTLPNGRHITVLDFIQDLRKSGIVMPSQEIGIRYVNSSAGYGPMDNILTEIQLVDGGQGDLKTIYTFNPWKEIMGGQELFGGVFDYSGDYSEFKVHDAFKIIDVNPREGVKRLRETYTFFTSLPKSFQEEFLGLIKSFPCFLEHEIRGFSHFRNSQVKDFISRAVNGMVPEYLLELKHALTLMADHNICVGKEEIIRRQIENLLDFDVTTIPDHWEKGHLDERVVAEKREELNILLDAKR